MNKMGSEPRNALKSPGKESETFSSSASSAEATDTHRYLALLPSRRLSPHADQSRMFSDEEFSLVPADDPSHLLQSIHEVIEKLKGQHDDLLNEHKQLLEDKNSNINFTQEFQQRAGIVRQRLKDEKMNQTKASEKEMEKLSDLENQESKLKAEILKVQQELQQTNETHQSLKQQTEVSTTVPEKKVVFNGEVAEEGDSPSFDVKANIVYPMEGGTAVITFEEEAVAEKILALKEHVVQLGDCSITVQADPVQFLIPVSVEMDTQVCPQRILVSNLPKKESMERILDKLEIHFSKTRNGGGEVEEVVLLEDSGNVVIKFVHSNIAKSLTDQHMHEIEIDRGKRYKVMVTPFLNGEITLLETSNLTCSRTVLLTGIPAVLEKESLQDMLEIHFQKSANSGGEVDGILYNPVGERALAVFEEVTSKPEQNM